jgi:predicted dehydrogenase
MAASSYGCQRFVRRFISLPCWCAWLAAAALLIGPTRAAEDAAAPQEPKTFRLGIIGLDTSHAIAFTELINGAEKGSELATCRVVAAYPKGSLDIQSSVVRVPRYTEQLREQGLEIVESIEALLERVDGVLLETNDGRPHREQLQPVLRAKKPVFIDKPVAGSLSDVVAIFEEAKAAGVPVFSSSSLRFGEAVQPIRQGAIGQVIGCDTYGPCSLEATHPDLFWYGIHGVESLFTVMGPGCQQVVRMSSDGTDVVVGQWSGGRIGTYRGIRDGKSGYGGTAYGANEIRQLGANDGYAPLVREIVRFFRTGKSPVEAAETLEIYAFMEAADESKRRGGVPVTLDEVLQAARAKASQ